MEFHPDLGRPSTYVATIWIFWAAIWLLASLRVKKTRDPEPAATRMAYLAPKVLTALLLFSPSFRVGILKERVIGTGSPLAWLGVGLTALGIGFTVWARAHIGRNWSARVVIKEQHELVRSGPYALVRHPIYTGLLLAIAGTALVTGEWRGVLALALAIIGFHSKATREENILSREFGEDFELYRRETGMLLPRIR
jgi:protein-S-isoprenylcysteine O-methyltransferase Ste14